MAMSDDSMNILGSVKGLLLDFGIDVDYNMDRLKEADSILSKYAKHGIGKNNKQKISYARSMVRLAIDAIKLQKKTRESFPGPKQKIRAGIGALSADEVRLRQTGGIPPSGRGAKDNFSKIYTDTNWAYVKAKSTPVGLNFFPPVTAKDAENMRREDAEKQDAVIRSRKAASRSSINLRKERLDGARHFPLWKKFFLDSHNEAKDIRHMSKTLTSISKVPLVGRLVHTSPLGLGVTAAMAGIAALNELLDKIRNATVKNVARENTELFYGKPSESFKKALESALISEPAEQAKIWGAFAQRGIPPEVGLGIVGAIARGGNPMMQKKAAESFGLSPNAVIASRFFTGELGINPKTDPARAYAARLNALTVEEEKNWGIGGNRWRAFELWLPYSKEIEARTGKSLSRMAGESATNFAPMMNTRFVNPNAMLPAINKLKAAEEAARASISYDASSAKNVSHVTTIDNKPNVVTYIDNLNLPSVTNQKEFTDEMIKNSKSSNTAILDSFVSFE